MYDSIKQLDDETELSKSWYNIVPNLPGSLSPVLHPAIDIKIADGDLAALFPDNIIESEQKTP